MRTGKSTVLVFGSLSVIAVVTATWLLLSIAPQSTEARAIVALLPTQQVTSQQLQLALVRAGLGPEALAAAGVTGGEQVQAVVNAVRNQLVNTGNAFINADSSVGVARQVVAELERRVQSGSGSGEDVTALSQARQTLMSETAARDELVNGLFSAGTFSLPSNQGAMLATIRTNAQRCSTPVEFLCVNRSESQWVALRDALAHERIAIKRGTDLDANVQAALTEARGVNAVSTATSNLTTHLNAVRQAWTAATTANNG